MLMNVCLRICCFISLFFAFSCQEKTASDTVIVGISADNPPYEFFKNNEIVGIDIDIINEIARVLGKKVVIKNLDFQGLLASLSTKNVDLVISGLAITEGRKSQVDFSSPYASTSIAILSKKADNIHNINDLHKKIVGAQTGSTCSKISDSLSDRFDFKSHTLSSIPMMLQELSNNLIDAILIDSSVANNICDTNSQFSAFTLENAVAEFAIAFPKGSVLKEQVNIAIEYLQKQGILNQILKKWIN